MSSPLTDFHAVNWMDNASTKPYYITTPIFYPNADPHIGHLYSMVTADIFARYSKLKDPDREVRFVTGTDEHGVKIEKAAAAKGMKPLAFCDEISQHFHDLRVKGDIDATCFARTTNPEHEAAVQDVWNKLTEKGLVYKGQHEGWYSISDECFYTDSQVTKISNPDADTATWICTETGSEVEWTHEENYVFRLSQFRNRLLRRYLKHPDIIYPAHWQADIIASLKDAPLQDLSISRPASRSTWGVPVPNDPAHTIYVWIDALTVYLSAVGYPWPASDPAGLSHGWPADLQIIGKDIVRFHAIYFPALLQALDLPLPPRIIAHAHWTAEGGKMSKSRGNVADPAVAIEKYGADAVRFYLARVGGRFRHDTLWSEAELGKQAEDITALLGNLYLRVASLKVDRRAPPPAPPLGWNVYYLVAKQKRDPLLALQGSVAGEVSAHLDALNVAEALERIIAVMRETNRYMTALAPWSAKTPLDTAQLVHADVVESLRICSILLQPFMPVVSGRLLDAMGVPGAERSLQHAGRGAGRASSLHPITVFPKRLPAKRTFEGAKYVSNTKRPLQQ